MDSVTIGAVAGADKLRFDPAHSSDRHFHLQAGMSLKSANRLRIMAQVLNQPTASF